MITESELLAKVPNQLFIGGSWVDSTSGRAIDVHDPATGLVIRTIADASVEDAAAAMNAAVAAKDGWAATAPRVRAEILRSAFDLLQERADEFALLMTLEMGKPLAEARGEVTYGGEFLRWFSEEAVRISGRYGKNPEGTGRMIVTHLPVGPSFLITPWNFPLAMATRKIAPALAAGCTAIIKPAELTPLTTLYFAKLLEDVGLPKGVLNVLTTSTSKEVSSPIIADRRLRKLSFTGSTGVGQLLLKQASENVLRTSMELGGNAPFVVFEDADLDKAVDGAMIAKFRNIGQACTAANRFIVHESVAKEFAAKITARVAQLTVGRGTEEGVTIGPLINAKAIAKVEKLVTEAIAQGATATVGGARHALGGLFYQPTVLTGATARMRLFQEEIFGPVAPIVKFDTEAEAIDLANATPFGLASYFYSRDVGRCWRVAEAIEAGMVGINEGLISTEVAPFGGVKDSGLGREGSSEGLDEYLETKYLCFGGVGG